MMSITPQKNIQIKCSPNQNSNRLFFFGRNGRIGSKIGLKNTKGLEYGKHLK